MIRTTIRFLLVLLIGGGLLWFFSRGQGRIRITESPSIVTGQLGDVGAPVPRSGGRRLRVTPIRNVVIRQLAKLQTAPPKKGEATAETDTADATIYQSITELHGSSAEMRADETQVITDALFVRELDETSILPAAERRTLFKKVLAYEPSAAQPVGDDPTLAKKITHVRIAAGRAEIVASDRGSPRIRFYGDPPDGVQITAFDERAEPVLEFRTEFLLARQTERDETVEFAITSPKRVHFFSPDGRYRLSGDGLRGHFVRPEKRKGETQAAPSSGDFVIERAIRLEAPEGIVKANDPAEENAPTTSDEKTSDKKTRDKKSNRVYRNKGVITCVGPARFRMNRLDRKDVKSDGPESNPTFNYLTLHNRVRAHYESTALEDGVAVGHTIQDLAAERLDLRFRNRDIDAVVARHDVRAKVVHYTPLAPSGDRVDLQTSQMQETMLDCQRARLAFEAKSPKWIRAYAWSTTTVCLGVGHFGPVFGGLPVYVPPRIEGRVRAKNLDEGTFRATCRREILMEQKPRKGTGRLTLLEDVDVDFEGAASGGDETARAKNAGKKKKDKKKKPSWLPGFSGLKARDRVVIDHFDRPNRLLDFLADGDVRIETVMGRMTAQQVKGTVIDTDRWRVEADGDPVLDLPISSRSSDRFGRILRDLTLDRAGPSPRASETAGRIRIEGQRAAFEMDRGKQPKADAKTGKIAKTAGNDKNEKRPMRGAARFTSGVRVTQQEASSAPIRLFCRDLRFRFEEEPGAERATTSEIVADGDVVIDAGPGVRASGDRLTFDRRSGDQRSGTLVGYPARLRLVDRHKRKAILEGRTITLDSTNRRAMAQTGAFARFHPSRDTRFSIPGSESGTVTLDAIEIDADRAEIGWRDGQSLSAFRAFDAVRVRGFDRTKNGEATGRLLQWAEADELHYELGPKTKGQKEQSRELRLVGQIDQPVRMGYRDPTRAGDRDDYYLEVPVLVVRGDGEQSAPSSMSGTVSGYGPGRIRMLSQDNVFGTKAGAAGRSEVIDLRFRNGFTMRQVEENRSRLDFPDGGELISSTREGKEVAHLEASKTLALNLNTAKRKKGEDLRVIESGYAEGDVKIRYRNDTTGGADAVTWRRGTNTVIMAGDPTAWLKQPGQASSGKQIIYNMTTRRVRIVDFAGRLRRQFEGKEKTP